MRSCHARWQRQIDPIATHRAMTRHCSPPRSATQRCDSPKKESICAKLTKAGVASLHGAPSALASGRRYVLIEFAVRSGLVTPDDVALLDGQ